MQYITSQNNPLIKEIISLQKKKNRWENRKFIIEGTKLIKEAIDYRVNILKIIYTDDLFNSELGQELYDEIINYDNTVYIINELFNKISNVENTQGVLGIVEFKTLDMSDLSNNGILFYLDGLQDPGNMGTIIRSADAFGISGLIIGKNCVDPYNPKVVRATMGSIFRVPLYFESKRKHLSDNILSNRRIVATSLSDSKTINDFRFNESDIIIIGNEGNGVSEDMLDISDIKIFIPMLGDAESLNAGVAASIIMYECSRQSIK